MASSSEITEEVIQGYLHKRTRDGRWQRRWFETNGSYLTYYKSKKMEKLLAALSLPQVGDIRLVDSTSPEAEGLDGLFIIELNTRVYTLRAKSDAEALVWVNQLNLLRHNGDKNGAMGVVTPMANVSDPSMTSFETSTSMDSRSTTSDWIKPGNQFICC